MLPDLTPTQVPDPVAADVAVDPAPTVNVVQPSVKDLLELSQSAHMRYQQHLPRMAAVVGLAMPQAQSGDPDSALLALKAAAATRAQAELIDPDHRDPAWQQAEATHPAKDLLVFYVQQLSK
jgi:hypothetical protein